MPVFTIKDILNSPNSSVPAQHTNKSNLESQNKSSATEAESSRNGPKEAVDVDTGQSRNTDSGIGTSSGSFMENDLCSTQKTPLQKEKLLSAAISTPLNDREPARVSEIIHIPGPSTEDVQELPGEGKRKRMKKFHYCIYCTKKFDRPSLLKRHTYTHTKEKPWKCQYCNKGFNTKSLVITHERVHTGEKPFVCEFCGKTFNAGSNFSFHRDIHLKKRKHQCKVCEKRFVTPGDLRKHSFTHTGNWPFRCSQCNRGYATERSLRNHEPVHSRVKPFPCTLCNRSYTTESSLKTHMRQHQTPQQQSCPATPSQEPSGNQAPCNERPQSTSSLSNPNNQAPPLGSQPLRTSLQPGTIELTQSRLQTQHQSGFSFPGMNPGIPTPLTSFLLSANPQVHEASIKPMHPESQRVSYCNQPGWDDSCVAFRTPSPNFRQPLSVLHDVDPQIRSLKNQFEGLGLKVSNKGAFTVVENRETRPNLLEPRMNSLWNINPMGSRLSRQYRPPPWLQPSDSGQDDLPLDLSTKRRDPRS